MRKQGIENANKQCDDAMSDRNRKIHKWWIITSRLKIYKGNKLNEKKKTDHMFCNRKSDQVILENSKKRKNFYKRIETHKMKRRHYTKANLEDIHKQFEAIDGRPVQGIRNIL